MAELIHGGNIKLALCFACYLAWWVVAFNPSRPVRGMRSGWILIPALVLGVLALVDIARGLVFASGGLVPGFVPAVAGVLAYLVLLGVTYGLLHRPVTSELFIIVLWASVAAMEVNSLVALRRVDHGLGWALMVAIVFATVLSIVCYQKFYELDAKAGFVDGAIPLLLAAVMTGALALLSGCSASSGARLADADFGIATYVSPYDADADGMDDQADILASARAYLDTKPQYGSAYYDGGWPNDGQGVCTDVVAYGLLGAGYNLQELVDADVRAHPEAYDIEKPDANIDYRRVRNLIVYLNRHATPLTCDTSEIDQWQGGDIVAYTEHIGLVSDARNDGGVPWLIHHERPGQKSYEENRLASWGKVVGHWRWNAELL